MQGGAIRGARAGGGRAREVCVGAAGPGSRRLVGGAEDTPNEPREMAALGWQGGLQRASRGSVRPGVGGPASPGKPWCGRQGVAGAEPPRAWTT